MTFRIDTVTGSAELADVTQRLLDLLPTWFGIPEANAEYVDSARRLPGRVLWAGTEIIGVLLYRRHFPESAEIHLIAVHPEWHRRGAGRSMVEALVTDLTAAGCRLLQVKTLGPSHPDEGYVKTRAFYRATGFLPLEEMLDLWPDNPCLIMVRML